MKKIKKNQKNTIDLALLKQKVGQLKKEFKNLELRPLGKLKGYIETMKLPAVGMSIQDPLMEDLSDEEKREIITNYKMVIDAVDNELDNISLQLSSYRIISNLRKWDEVAEKKENFKKRIVANIKKMTDAIEEIEYWKNRFFQKKS